jgi:hypothetical protein
MLRKYLVLIHTGYCEGASNSALSMSFVGNHNTKPREVLRKFWDAAKEYAADNLVRMCCTKCKKPVPYDVKYCPECGGKTKQSKLTEIDSDAVHSIEARLFRGDSQSSSGAYDVLRKHGFELGDVSNIDAVMKIEAPTCMVDPDEDCKWEDYYGEVCPVNGKMLLTEDSDLPKAPWTLDETQVQPLKAYETEVVDEDKDGVHVEFSDEEGHKMKGTVPRKAFADFPFALPKKIKGMRFLLVTYKVKGFPMAAASAWPTEQHWNPGLRLKVPCTVKKA